MKILIYTDGACSGNPGIGGWGVVILVPREKPVHLNGGSNNTTNNQMELTATIEGLQYFKESKQILIITDSKYVINGIESWIKNWKKNGWKTASKKPVKNKDLWEKLDKEITKHTIEWQWVKGHAGNDNNEKADYLARRFIEEN
jgi:ribonuclease HI